MTDTPYSLDKVGVGDRLVLKVLDTEGVSVRVDAKTERALHLIGINQSLDERYILYIADSSLKDKTGKRIGIATVQSSIRYTSINDPWGVPYASGSL